jgi:signal transduction histidine kinase
MLIATSRGRLGTLLRLTGLAAVMWSIFQSHTAPATGGRGLVVLVACVLAVVAWLVWTFWSSRQTFMTADLYVLALCGSLLQIASPGSAGSVFTFVAAMSAGARCGLLRGLVVAALGAAAVGVGAIVYNLGGLAVLAYSLGFAATTLGGANIRQTRLRLDQAELLLAQTQRSHEEQLRAARLEESARIARDIHDVLAHTLAGLVIQLEATDALLAQNSDREIIRERVQRAHRLAREGLLDARRAVGALRGQSAPGGSVAAAVAGLVDQYEDRIALVINGDERRLGGPAGEAVLRVLQEALTNVRKHAPGAEVAVTLTVVQDHLELLVEDRVLAPVRDDRGLAPSGGGYGLPGMRERAAELGGSLVAGPTEDGWHVRLRLPLGPASSPA